MVWQQLQTSIASEHLNLPLSGLRASRKRQISRFNNVATANVSYTLVSGHSAVPETPLEDRNMAMQHLGESDGTRCSAFCGHRDIPKRTSALFRFFAHPLKHQNWGFEVFETSSRLF